MLVGAKDKLLRSLRFSTWNARQRQLEGSPRRIFSSSCERLFETVADPEWSSFTAWLQTGQGVYWINGTEGSGKSTLMDYVVHSERTLSALSHWRKPNTPLILSYHFWAHGDTMQRCPKGMLCALLYQLAWASDDFVTTLLTRPGVEYKRDVDDWLFSELITAFSHTVSLHDIPTCIFLDGLDECNHDKNSQGELLKTINQLLELQQLKICCSSLLEDAFSSEFATCPSLRMRDFNRSDIKAIAAQLLREAFTDDHYVPPAIIETIEQRAEGSFLWVYPAIKLILRMVQPDQWGQLRLGLEVLPPSLDQLLTNVWSYDSKMSQSNPEAASLYFETLIASGDRIDLITFTAATDNTIRESYLVRRQRIAAADFVWSCKRAEQQLNILCGDLVEFQSPKQKTWWRGAKWYAGGDPREYLSYYHHYNIAFTHPLLRDFLIRSRSKQLSAHDLGLSRQQAQVNIVEGMLVTAIETNIKKGTLLTEVLGSIGALTSEAEQVSMISRVEQIVTRMCRDNVRYSEHNNALAATLNDEERWTDELLLATLKDTLGFHAYIRGPKLRSYLTNISMGPKRIQQSYLDAMLTLTLSKIRSPTQFDREGALYMLVEHTKLGELLLEKGADPMVDYLGQYRPVERVSPFVEFILRFDRDGFDKELTTCRPLVPLIVDKLARSNAKLQHPVVISADVDILDESTLACKCRLRCCSRTRNLVQVSKSEPSRVATLLVEMNMVAFLHIALTLAGMFEYVTHFISLSGRVAPRMNVFGVIRQKTAGSLSLYRCRTLAMDDSNMLLEKFQRLLRRQILVQDTLREGQDLIRCIKEVYERSEDINQDELMISKGFWRREKHVDGDITFIKPFED